MEKQLGQGDIDALFAAAAANCLREPEGLAMSAQLGAI